MEYSIGSYIYYRMNGEDPEQFEIEDRKVLNGTVYVLAGNLWIATN